jgi:hypothetical protein
MSKKINFKITYGIHILLNIHDILSSIKKTDIISINIDLCSLKSMRNDINNKYMEKYVKLVEEIFIDFKNVEVIFEEMNYQNIPYNYNWIQKTLNNDWKNIFIRKNNYFTKYDLNNIILPENYLCINTKIVNSSTEFNTTFDEKYNFIKKFNFLKTDLYKLLNNSNIKIILLGERNIPDCHEYNYHRDKFGNYILYNDFKNNLNNIIDETYDNSKDGYNLDNWKKTCYYLSNSKFNIYIGNGGGIHLYSHFNNCIQFGVSDRLLNYLPKENIETNYINIIDSEDFLINIKNNIKNNINHKLKCDLIKVNELNEDVEKVETEDVEKVETEDVEKVETEDVEKVETEDVEEVEAEIVVNEEVNKSE